MRLVFAHVPKTGGTAINEALRRMKPQWIRHRSVFDDLPEFGAEALARADYCSGHFTRHSLDAIPEGAFRMTIMRDPVARVLSHIRFCRAHRAKLPVPAWRAAQELDLNDLFFQDIPGIHDHFGNWMVRAFVPPALLRPEGRFACSGAEALRQAAAYLDGFDLVGTHDRLQQTFAILCSGLGLGAAIVLPKRRDRRELASSALYRDVELEPLAARTRQRLEEMTALDRRLFVQASAAFERRLAASRQAS